MTTLTGKLRLAWRFPTLIIWTIALVGLRLFLRPMHWFRPGWDVAGRAALVRAWGKGALFILGGRLVLEGPPPRRPFMLVANHLTYVDVFALQSVLGAVFIAMAELSRWPMAGFIAIQMQTIFIDRKSLRDVVRVADLLHGAWREGHGVVLFAEGAIAQDGVLQEFRPSLLEVAARDALPVYCAAISYETAPGLPAVEDIVHWRGTTTFGAHIKQLMTCPGFTATVRFAPEPVTAGDRKLLARALHDVVAELQQG